jgi:membrane-bound lytic murein transglycosylase D
MTLTKIRYIWIVGVLALLAGCAHSTKPKIEPPASRAISQPAQPIPAETKPPRQEQPKTIIPEEEKKAAAEAAAAENTDLSKNGNGTAGLLEEALSSYQEAKTCREGGDLDGALKALDKAYDIMLKAKVPADSPLLQEKNDLRILIAQRIQEIYACRINPIANGGNAMSLVENKWVRDEIKSFQTVERSSFNEAYKRSGLYRKMIAAEFKKLGLPEELSWLPVIESGFTARVLSRARALGLWQFIASTGYRYGLNRDRWVDERMDPEKATRAAAKFLNDLHTTFGDWATALAAYNCGEFAVQNVINTQHINYLDDFWDLFSRLPFETARFVPRFMAIALITKNPEKYGFTLPEPYAALKYETIQVNRPVKLTTLSTALGLDAAELALINPELRFDSTPDTAYDLKVPLGLGEKTLQSVDNLPKFVPPAPEVVSYSWHLIKPGDTLWGIAHRYGTSIDMLLKLNGITRNATLLPGRRLKVPGKGGLATG